MTSLQKISLGTVPTGQDGDTTRAANVKMNSNVDVLNAQAALTSATTITSPRGLDNTYVGKRVNISFSTAGSFNLPQASTCVPDSVILLRNIGNTVATAIPKTSSGDVLAISKLNPGETALVDTDGVNAWNVLMRGRTNNADEAVNGNLSVGGSVSAAGGWSGDFSATGKVSGVVSPNLLLNGSWELGNTGWTVSSFAAAQDATAGNASYASNTAAFTGTPVYDYSGYIPVAPGTSVCIQAVMSALGLTAGLATVGVEFRDASNNLVGTSSVSASPGASNIYRSALGVAPASTSKMRARIGVTSSPTGAVGSVRYSNVKLEIGTVPSLYSQEASIAYLQAAPIPGRLLNVRVLTGSGTYTPTAGTSSVIVELQGAGAGSAGLVANNSAQAGISGSGATGGYVRHRYTSGFSGLAYSVGAAGAAGPVGNGFGGNGGDTTFGALVAGGGQGSATVQTVSSTSAGSGTPGTATGGNLLNIPGHAAPGAWVIISAGMIVGTPALPSAMFGMQYGWGAPGRLSGGNSAAMAGLPSGPGVIFVSEYA